ncbi:WD repeat-containing protein WRAP73 isoform X3 [Pezoporus wallicus]|uniref:WD repeat-containing protein WRAP73 isoform X3 n=1 Tax=Pezoporus wallicus TaxID=35540 RepID=UPI00254C5175|nr:WD repeat-containing protein WRAP73 isoform X3 [Pezoporus wallicus]XP_061306387.1 WD repeat-containing protein WRAP73 isoform X3 [Pezoporus flaviventris]
MNFSELFKLSGLLGRFSPDGRCLASCMQYRLAVRDAGSLQILHLYTCLDQIQYIEWSSDSLFILCAMYKRGIVQVWSLEQPDWHCKIDEGSAGLVASCWSPDGRHILNTTEFHLRITVWSLCTKSVSYIKYPKACQQGIAFTKDGRYMAVAERRDCKDFISIFVCSDWQLLRHFDTETQDLFGIEWAPNGCVLAVWDTCLEYKILLYSLDGRLLSTYRAYEWSLGIKSVAWSPSSQFLAIGSYDEKIVYKEVEKSPSVETERLSFPPTRALASSLFSTQSKYAISEVPLSLHYVKPASDRANPKMGIGMLAFSPDNCFLATKNDNIPNAVWIWDIQKLKLSVVLEQLCAIQCFQWDPRQPRLAVCTGNSNVYLWSPAGCVSVQVPVEGDFPIVSLSWHSSGDSMVLLSKDNFCVCYLEREEVK